MSNEYNDQPFCPSHVLLAMCGAVGVVPPAGDHDQLNDHLDEQFEAWAEDLGLEHHLEPRLYHAFLAELVVLIRHEQQEDIYRSLAGDK